MISVVLHGALARFGRKIDLRAASPAEAVHALTMQLPEFAQALRQGWFAVRFGGRAWTEEMVRADFAKPAEGVLHIVPRVQGAGRFGQIIAGVVLIIASIYVPALAPYAVSLMAAGIGMVAGGVAQLLTKPPSPPNVGGNEKQSRNSAFSNLDNTAGQGLPVPLAYGRVYCGSRVVSQGVQTRRLESAAATAAGNPNARDATLMIRRDYVQGQAARAPNGRTYQTDFAHDSVRVRNYVSVLQEG